MGKGQVWSLDLMIGMLVFLLAVGTIYSFLNINATPDPTPLRIESEVVATVLTSGGDTPALQVAAENQLDMNALGQLAIDAESDYGRVKDLLGIEHDFCIYLQDDEGNLVYIQDASGNVFSGVGPASEELNLTDDTPCGARIV